jgi:sugar lactone lactonase YvrE
MWSVLEQALYWTDTLGGRIYRLEPESRRNQSFVLGRNVMAIGLREGGGLVFALAKQLSFYEPGGELVLLMGVEHDQPRNRFNDGKVDRCGRYSAGTMNDLDWDQPSGSLDRLDADLELKPTTRCGGLLQRARLEPRRPHLLLRRALPLHDLRLRLRPRLGRPLGPATVRDH